MSLISTKRTSDLSSVLDTVVAAGEAVLTSLQVDQRSAVRGFIAGSLPQPAHRHTPSGVEAVSVPTLSEVLDRIVRQIFPLIIRR